MTRSLADDSLIGMAVDYYAGRGDSLEIQSLYYQGEAYSIFICRSIR